MRKRIFSIVISFVMILSLSISPVFGETNDWWTGQRVEIIKGAELEMEKYIESKSEEVKITTSGRFQENLNEAKSMMGDEFDYLSLNETLTDFLNKSLEVSDMEVKKQLISYAQDYNSSRSNKPSSINSENISDDQTDDNQNKAKDYNSSRSNKPRTEVFIGDEDSDDDIIEDSIYIDIRIPIEKANITLIENLEIDEIDFNLDDKNADLILAMVFVSSIQENLKSSDMLNQCELNSESIAFYFQDKDNANHMYLKDEFFIPLIIDGSGDCDDSGVSNPKPGEQDPDDDDDYIGDGDENSKLIFKIGNENVKSGNIDKVLEVSPFIENNRTMVPFRFIGEELGAEIEWNAEERKVEYRLGDNLIELWIGQNTARVNGREVMLDEDPSIKPFIINSRTVVPVRFISEALGFNVNWNEETKEITVENGNPLYEGGVEAGENPLYSE